jgi:hypothetical protein
VPPLGICPSKDETHTAGAGEGLHIGFVDPLPNFSSIGWIAPDGVGQLVPFSLKAIGCEKELTLGIVWTSTGVQTERKLSIDGIKESWWGGPVLLLGREKSVLCPAHHRLNF